MARAMPPDDIHPRDFFTRWVPETVGADDDRRRRLGDTVATLEFELMGEGGGLFTVVLQSGTVWGGEGPADSPDLRIRLDVTTWKALNAGDLSAPEAFLRRRVQLEGNLALAVKLHLIIG
jgi:putative sterol carrier protein